MATREEIDAYKKEWLESPAPSNVLIIDGAAVTPQLDRDGKPWGIGEFERAFFMEYGYEYEGPASLVVIDVEVVSDKRKGTKGAVDNLTKE